MHLTLPGCEGGDCLAQEEPQLLAPFSDWWNVLIQGSSPWLFPSTLKFSENDLSSPDEPF